VAGNGRPRPGDPRLVTAARELRDRWMERVNDDPLLLASAGSSGAGAGAKYDVTRVIAARSPLPNDQPAFGAPARALLAA
jgi:hypothetical protein